MVLFANGRRRLNDYPNLPFRLPEAGIKQGCPRCEEATLRAAASPLASSLPPRTTRESPPVSKIPTLSIPPGKIS